MSSKCSNVYFSFRTFILGYIVAFYVSVFASSTGGRLGGTLEEYLKTKQGFGSSREGRLGGRLEEYLKNKSGIKQFQRNYKIRHNEYGQRSKDFTKKSIERTEETRNVAKTYGLPNIYANPWTEESLNQIRTTFRKEEIDSSDINDLNLEKLLESMSVGHNGLDFKPIGLKSSAKPRSFERYTDMKSFQDKVTMRKKRSFIPRYEKLNRYWPNGTIPYYIVEDSYSDPDFVEMRINKSIEHIEHNTCIRFVKLSLDMLLNQEHFILIVNGGPRCSSKIGRYTVYPGQFGQIINLYDSWFCLLIPTIVHEIGHALGMYHEFQRADRDDHLTVIFENISPGMENQFSKMDNTKLRVPFDYYSMMQYHPLATSKNSNLVLEVRDPDLEFLMDSNNGFSYYDLFNIHKSYKCSASCTELPCKNGGYTDHTCTCRCPDGLQGSTCDEVVNQEYCGGIIDVRPNQKTIVQSPNFRAFSPEGAKCYWLLKAPEDYAITIEMKEFNLAWNNVSKRCYHWLEIQYNLIGQPGPKFCGDCFSRGKISTSKFGEPNLMMLTLDTKSVADVPQAGGFKFKAQAYRVYGIKSDGCSPPPGVENTSNNYDIVGSKNGAIVKYQCIGDYTMFGDLNTITCQAYGTWSNVRFRCELKDLLVTCNFDTDDCNGTTLSFFGNQWERIELQQNGFLRIQPYVNTVADFEEAVFEIPTRLEPYTEYCLSFSMRRPLGNAVTCTDLILYGVDQDLNVTLLDGYYPYCYEVEWTEYRKTIAMSRPFHLMFFAELIGYGSPFNLDVDNIKVREGRC